MHSFGKNKLLQFFVEYCHKNQDQYIFLPHKLALKLNKKAAQPTYIAPTGYVGRRTGAALLFSAYFFTDNKIFFNKFSENHSAKCPFFDVYMEGLICREFFFGKITQFLCKTQTMTFKGARDKINL